MRPHDETRNDVGARIPLGRTPLPPTAPRTRRKTDLGIKMSRADNMDGHLTTPPPSRPRHVYLWNRGLTANIQLCSHRSRHAIIFIVRCIPTALHAQRRTPRRTRRHRRFLNNARKTNKNVKSCEAATFTQTRKIRYVHFNATL